MQNIKLFIDDIEVDIVKYTPININYSLKDIKNYGKRNSSSSKPISVLKTPQSNKVFKTLYNINSVDGYDINKKYNGRLEVDGITILKGYILVDSITSDTYEVILSNNNINLFYELGDDLIKGNVDSTKDIKFSGDELHTYSYSRQAIRDSWKIVENKPVIFTMNDYFGDIENHDYEKNPPVLPAIKVDLILDKIFKRKGFSYVLSPKLQEYIKDMYIPYNDIFDKISNESKVIRVNLGDKDKSWYTVPNINLYNDIYGIKGVLITNFYFDRDYNYIKPEDKKLNKNLQSVYTPSRGKYIFDVKIDGRFHNKGDREASLLLLGQNPTTGEYLSARGDIKGQKQGETPIFSTYNFKFEFPDVNKDFRWELFLESDDWDKDSYGNIAPDFDILCNAASSTSDYASMTITHKWLYDENHTITENDVLPVGYKQSDLLNDIMNTFNVYIDIDSHDENKLYLYTRDEYYSNQKIIDISNKIDDKSIKIKNISAEIANNNIFKLGEGSDVYNIDSKTKIENGLYSNVIINDSDFAVESNEISLSYVPTAYKTLFDNSFGTDTSTDKKDNSIVYSKFLSNEKGLITNIGNRLLYRCHKKFADWTTGVFGTDKNMIYCNIFELDTLSPSKKYVRDNTDNIFLGFNNLDYYKSKDNPVTISNQNLYNKFYKDELNLLFNSKLLIVKANLNNTFINSLDFSNKYFISNKNGSAYYLLNSIKNYNPATCDCELELIYINPSLDTYVPSIVPTNIISLAAIDGEAKNPAGSSTTISGGGGSSSGGVGTSDEHIIEVVTPLLAKKADLLSPNFSGFPTVDGSIMYHADNSNKYTIDWTAKDLYSNNLYLRNNNDSLLYFQNTSGTERGRIRSSSGGTTFIVGNAGVFIRPVGDTTTNQLLVPQSGSMTLAGNTVWDAGNANSTTIDWTAKKLNAVEEVSTNNLYANNIYKRRNGVYTNLGTPSVEEMAILDTQMTNKFRFNPATLQEESTDGSTWINSSRASQNTLMDLMIGEGNMPAILNAIPSVTLGQQGYYRLTWDNSSGNTGYVSLNSLYIYCSTNGNTITFTVEAYHNTAGWQTITTGTANNWPGHVYIPHTGIWYNATNANQWSKVRVTFANLTPTNTNAFQIYGIEWLGGYPSSKKTLYSIDRNKRFSFPAGGSFAGTLNVGTAIYATSNITSGATVSAKKVISNTTFKAEGRAQANFVGNWNGSSFWGLGEDTTADYIKLIGCDADGVFNSTPVGLKLSGNVHCASTLQSTLYSGTGFGASGWGIDIDGNLNIKSLTVRELARFYELEIAKVRAVNGGLAITAANSKITGIDIDNNKIFVDDKDYDSFVVNDIVRVQKWENGSRGFKAYISSKNEEDRSFTLSSFSYGDLTQVKIGDDILVWDSDNAGRDGVVYMSANDTGSPFIDIMQHQITKARMGNIGYMKWNGTNIPENTIGYWADGDVYINNGYFSGQVQVTGGNIYNKTAIDSSLSNINSSIGNINSSIGGIGSFAWNASIYQAMQKETIIKGGYINTDLINAGAIIVSGGGATKAYVDASIGTVNSSIGTINTNITNLNSSVNTATNTANTANSTANTANSTANTANSTANTANTNATSANNKVNDLSTNYNTWKATVSPIAFKSSIEQAMKDESMIIGGYLQNKFINTQSILLSDTAQYIINAKNIYVLGSGYNRNATPIISTDGGKTNLISSSRGHTLLILNRTDLSISEGPLYYDTYGSTSVCDNLATKLNSLSDNVIVCLASYDACQVTQNLANAISRCGGTGKTFGAYRIPYAFVGIPNIGANKGIEVYTSEAGDAPRAEISCKVNNGMIDSAGSVANKFTYMDANGVYTGTLIANQIIACGGATTSDVTTAKNSAISTAASDATSKASTAQTNAQNFTTNTIGNKFTYINGSGIYTGTLTANQINAAQATVLGNVTAGSFNIGSGKFVVDTDGNLTATSANITGIINATAGNFTGKINADSGRFGNIGGGVNITGYGLQSDVFNNRYSIMGLGVTFGICKENHDVENGFRFDGSGKLAGGNITWTNSPDYTVNINGTITNATNAVNAVNANNASNLNGISADNYVRYNNGNILSNKIVVGKGVSFMNFTTGSPTSSQLSISESLVFVVSNYSNTDRCYVEMPSLSDIRNNLGIGVGVKFQIAIKVIAKYDTPRLFYVGTNNGEYRTYDYNSSFSDFKLSNGDSIEILIISDGTNTWGQITGVLR